MILDLLYTIDIKILLFINQTLSNPIFDIIMPLFDNVKNWIPFILFFWLCLSYFDKKNRWRLLILIHIVILIGDQFGKYIKHLELRDRPWFALGDIINHLGGKGGKHYSFPSNHALNITSITGQLINQLSKAINKLNPDIIILFGDRYETFAAAIAAIPDSLSSVWVVTT